MKPKPVAIDRAQHFLNLLGWSIGDAAIRHADGQLAWLVTGNRDEQHIVAKAHLLASIGGL